MPRKHYMHAGADASAIQEREVAFGTMLREIMKNPDARNHPVTRNFLNPKLSGMSWKPLLWHAS